MRPKKTNKTLTALMVTCLILAFSCNTKDPNQESDEMKKLKTIYSKNLSVKSGIPENIKDDRTMVTFYEKYYKISDRLSERIYLQLNPLIYKGMAISQKSNGFSYDPANNAKETIDIAQDLPSIARSLGSFAKHTIIIGASMLKLTYLEEKYCDEYAQSFSAEKTEQLNRFKRLIDSAIIYYTCPVDDDFANSCNMELIPELLDEERSVISYFDKYKKYIYDIKEQLYAANKKHSLAIINGYDCDRTIVLKELRMQSLSATPMVHPNLPKEYKNVVKTIVKIKKHVNKNQASMDALMNDWSETKKNEFNGVADCYKSKTTEIFNDWMDISLKPDTLANKSLPEFFTNTQMEEFLDGI